MKVFISLLVILFVSGCALTKQARTVTAENIAAAHATTIDKTVSGTQIPNVSVSGSSNVVQIAPSPIHVTTSVSDNANTKGDASGDTRSSFHASISTWIAIAMAALALAVLIIAWVFFSKLSATGAAADRGFASSIDTVSTLASHTTDMATVGVLNAIKADLEKRRGQMKS